MSLTDPTLSKPGEQEDALRDLLSRPGWAVFVEYVQREWGPMGLRYQAEIDKALNLTDNDAAASQARQIRSAQLAILALLRWPEEEAKRLKRISESPALAALDSLRMSRGGI